MRSVELRVSTGQRLVTDITLLVEDVLRGVGDGLVNVFVPHATAGVGLMETGSGAEQDLADLVERILPADDRYRHRHGSRGHGRDHVLPALVAPSVTVPVLDGRPVLGTWQAIVVIDSNIDNPVRTVRVSFLPG